MDVGQADGLKLNIRLAGWWLRKKYAEGRSRDQIHEDMIHCANPLIRKLYKLLIESANNIDEIHQRSMIIDFGELFLWIINKDTGYYPQFIYVLKNILDMKEEFMPQIKKDYKKPEDWYVNRWHRSKERTAERREKGELTSTDLDYVESICVPQAQKERFDRTIKNLQEEMESERKRRRWRK